MLNPKDIYSNCDNTDCLDSVISEVEKEAEDYERYHREKLVYDRQKKNTQNLLFNPYANTGYIPEPVHRWNGRKPTLFLWLDDIMATPLLSGKGNRKLTNLCIKHRHVGNGLGLSIIANMQCYKSNVGTLSKALRSNLTFIALGPTCSRAERESIASEFSQNMNEEDFLKYLDHATKQSHSFLCYDLFPKPSHPSAMRRNLDTFLQL